MSTRQKICLIGLILFLFSITGLIFADKIVILKDGTKIPGKVAEQKNTIIVENKFLGKLTISKKNIRSINPMGEKKEEVRQVGEVLTDEDVIMNELIRFVPGEISKIKKNKPETVAVKRIKISGKYDVNDKIFETKLINEIVKRGLFTMVERQSLKVLLEEQQLSLSGLTEEEESKVGKLLGVDAFLDASIFVPNDYSMQSTIKIVDVEKNTVTWQDDFKGVYSGDLKLSVGVTYCSPMSYTFKDAKDNEQAKFKFNGKTGNSFGLTVRLGQKLSFTRLIELGLSLTIYENDFGVNKGKNKTIYSYDVIEVEGPATNTNTYQLEVSTGTYSSFNVAFLLKIHPSELFNSPKDFLHIYFGAGIDTGRFSYVASSDRVEIYEDITDLDIISCSILAGIEFKFFRAYSCFVEYNYLTRKGRVGPDYVSRFNRDTSKIRAGVMYYIFK